VADKLSLVPSISQPELFLSIFIIPLAIQWWAAWYPGAEPGGGGYVAQRMLSAKNENHAIGATLLFNFFHYALRPWPWIVVGLASLIVFPDIQSMIDKFPEVSTQYIKNDFAYPAMLREFLPVGLLGLVVASLIAAFMSTTASQLNWGSSYLVNDFYGRFYNPNATEKQKVAFGRFSTVVLMFFSVLLALVLQNALQAFQYLLMIGAGTGLLYILRWFWWRINAYSEITAMVAAGLFSLLFILIDNFGLNHLANNTVEMLGFTTSATYWNIIKFTGVVFLTSVSWILVTYLTHPVSDETLRNFYKKIRPGGPGWQAVVNKANADGFELVKESNLKWDVPTGIICMILGCIAIYSILFSIGNILYGNVVSTLIFIGLTVVSSFLLMYFWKKLKSK
jgi:Na+/proline symporter